MQEFDLYHWWKWFCTKRLISRDKRLRGIFHGRLNTIEGPDFESAEFQLDGKIYRGDIEIHVRSGDWQAHGHHMDPKYNQVILHLVLEEASDPVLNSLGQKVPTFSFSRFPPYKIQGAAAMCTPKIRPSDSLLSRLAFARFVHNGRALVNRMSCSNRDQILYQQLLYLIGKPRNTLPFFRLAEAIQWRDIVSLRKRYHISVQGWFYIFRRLAGLIGCDPSYPEERLLSSRSFQSKVWSNAGQRPFNRPASRLYGLAFFISRLPSESLHLSWHDILSQRLPVSATIDNLVRLHITPGKSGWGKGQVLEVAGNIILPYFYFESINAGSNGFADYLAELFFSLPRANEYGCLRKFSTVYHKEFSFYRDQAYLHLQNHFCTTGNCNICPLDHSAERD